MATTATLQRRPKDDSAAAIQTALDQLEVERATAQERVAAAAERRAALLRTGTAAQVRDADENAHLARLDVERLGALIQDLLPKLSVAVGREQLADVETLFVEAERATKTWAAWWLERYPKLAAEIARGLELERAADRARAEYYSASATAARDDDVLAAGGLEDVDLSPMPEAFGTGFPRSASLAIALPAVRPGDAIHMPAGYRLERPTPPGPASVYAR